MVPFERIIATIPLRNSSDIGGIKNLIKCNIQKVDTVFLKASIR
jgi:hypothetical protein